MNTAGAHLATVLAEACEHLGVDGRDARPLRAGTNALFLLQRNQPMPMVVRIGGGSDVFRIAQKEIRVAEWLAAESVPAARPIAGIAQPLDIGGYPVTLWEWVRADDEPPTAGDLGRMLRRLHALPAPRFELPRFDPLGRIDALLAPTASVDPDSLTYLRDECELLNRAYRQLTFDLPIGPIHGDAHTGNLMRSNGRAILIDLETFALGPREWELVPTAVQRQRFGLTEPPYRAFAEAYGFDVRVWSGYPVLRRIREVAITAWLLGTAAQQPGASEEFEMRVAALRGERDRHVWRRR